MRKILITGKNSYIGSNLEAWLRKQPEKYSVNTVGTKDKEWTNIDFSFYDVVVNVAGIAHVSEKNVPSELYYEINRDLCLELAKKSKINGVSQFVQISSMSVYGDGSEKIDNNSIERPLNHYGISKLQADNELKMLSSKDFIVTIVRPPMVYGKGSKGNYTRLANYVKNFPIFIHYRNKRSMIYITNLVMYISEIIDTKTDGIVLPQNKEYVCTTDMVKLIAKYNKKQIFMLPNIVGNLLLNIKVFNKVFGNLYYEYSNKKLEENLNLVSFEDSIKEIEEK